MSVNTSLAGVGRRHLLNNYRPFLRLLDNMVGSVAPRVLSEHEKLLSLVAQ